MKLNCTVVRIVYKQNFQGATTWVKTQIFTASAKLQLSLPNHDRFFPLGGP